MSRPTWALPFARAQLVLTGVLYVGLGLAFTFWPVEWTAKVGLVVENPDTVTEVRAFYGGLELGLGTFFTLCGLRRAWVGPGIVGLVCTYGGLAAVRGLSLLVNGTQGDLQPRLVAIELTGLTLAAVALWALRERTQA